MSATSPARAPRPAGRPAARPARTPARTAARPTARPTARSAGLRPPRLVAVPERIARRSRVPFLGLIALILLLGVSGLLLFNTWMQQSAFTATRLEDRASRLESRQQSLEMSLERTSDPQQLAVKARALGLVPAVHPAFVRLTDGKVLGEPTPAAATDSMRINPRPAVKPKVLAPAPRVVEVPGLTAQEKAQQAAATKKLAELRAARTARTQQGRVQQNVQQNGAGG